MQRSWPHRFPGAHAGAPNHGVVQFHVADFANHRVQQRRVPQPPAFTASRTKSFSLPKPAQASSMTASRDDSCYFMLRKSSCCVSLQAQYQAFVRFAVESSTASAIALNWTCVLEPFTRRALVSRTLASPVTLTGPVTLDRCCERNVVAPGKYSKRFFCVPIGLYRGIFRPATALECPPNRL